MKGSLNREARKRDMVRIMQENEALLRRIQSRPPNYSVRAWEDDYRRQEKLLHNIGQFPYQPNGKRRPKRGDGQRPAPPSHRPARNSGRKKHGTDSANDRTCVFSRTNIDINGVNSTLSVYERLNPFRLEFIALDQEERSTKEATSITFAELRTMYKDQPDILKPENTDDLVSALLPNLYFVVHPDDEDLLLLQFKIGGPSADDAVAASQDADDYTDAETEGGQTGRLDTGEVSPVSIGMSCSNVPKDIDGEFFVALKAKNEDPSGTVEVQFSEGSADAVFASPMVINMYEKIERELTFSLYSTGGQKFNRSKAQANIESGAYFFVGETSIPLRDFLLLPDGKIELKLLKEGQPVADGFVIRLENKQSDDDTYSESTELPENMAAKDPAAVLSKGGQKIGKNEFLYQVTEAETGRHWVFNLYLRSTGQTFEHAVPISDFSRLKIRLRSTTNINFGRYVSRKNKFANELLALFSAKGPADNLSLTFCNGRLWSLEELAPTSTSKSNTSTKKNTSPSKKSPRKPAPPSNESGEEDSAAIAVQSAWRGHKVRKEVNQKKREREEEDNAAVAVQSAWRGHKARIEVKQMKKKEAEAATTVQAAWRGHKTRSRLKTGESSANATSDENEDYGNESFQDDADKPAT